MTPERIKEEVIKPSVGSAFTSVVFWLFVITFAACVLAGLVKLIFIFSENDREIRASRRGRRSRRNSISPQHEDAPTQRLRSETRERSHRQTWTRGSGGRLSRPPHPENESGVRRRRKEAPRSTETNHHNTRSKRTQQPSPILRLGSIPLALSPSMFGKTHRS
jgi:hypothetical protein